MMRACRIVSMISNATQQKLDAFRFGPYVTPVIAIGTIVECEVRGLVTVVGQSEAPVPWPIGEKDGNRQLIVFKGLSRAIRQEDPLHVANAWGIEHDTAQAWRNTCKSPRRRKKQTL